MTLSTRQGSAGVTAIELALAVGATAILGAVGLSAYRTYCVRADVAHGIAAVEWVTHVVEGSFRRTGTPPATIVDLDTLVASSSPLGISVTIENGRIALTFGSTADEAIAGRSVYLTPFETAGQQIVWLCGNRPLGVGLNPLGYAGGANVAVRTPTDIEPRFLPASCR